MIQRFENPYWQEDIDRALLATRAKVLTNPGIFKTSQEYAEWMERTEPLCEAALQRMLARLA